MNAVFVRKNVWILTVFYCKMMRNMEKKLKKKKSKNKRKKNWKIWLLSMPNGFVVYIIHFLCVILVSIFDSNFRSFFAFHIWALVNFAYSVFRIFGESVVIRLHLLQNCEKWCIIMMFLLWIFEHDHYRLNNSQMKMLFLQFNAKSQSTATSLVYLVGFVIIIVSNKNQSRTTKCGVPT